VQKPLLNIDEEGNFLGGINEGVEISEMIESI